MLIIPSWERSRRLPGNLGKEVSMKEKSIEMAKCVLVYCIGLFIMW